MWCGFSVPGRCAWTLALCVAGLSAAVSIMAALMERKETGAGRYLDIAMLDGMLALLGQAVAAWGMTGNAPRRWGNGHPLMAPYESLHTADREIVVAVTNEKVWACLRRLPEFAEMANDARFASPPLRNEQRHVLVPAFEAILRTRPSAYWLEAFDAAGIAAEPINTLPEILDHPQVVQRGMMHEFEYPPGSGNRIRTAGMPWRAVAADRSILPPPTLGQHTDEVLAALQQPAVCRRLSGP